MERIKAGKFSLQGEEWTGVSAAAKNVIEGEQRFENRDKQSLRMPCNFVLLICLVSLVLIYVCSCSIQRNL